MFPVQLATCEENDFLSSRCANTKVVKTIVKMVAYFTRKPVLTA
jgi:hypothetical protein